MRTKRGLTKAERHDLDLETVVRLRHVEHLSIDQCAERMKVSPRTVKYWIASDEYKSKIKEMREDWREAAITHVAELSERVLQTMNELMDDPKSGHVRFEAAAKLGDWLGLGQQMEEQKGDDRTELERILKLQAERPQVTINQIYNQPVRENGLIPKVFLDKPEDDDNRFFPARLRKEMIVDANAPYIPDDDPIAPTR